MACPNISHTTISFDGSNLHIEHAKSEEELRNGLMHRDHLDIDKGMLFSYQTPANHSFWMKNTIIPLDMIFIDSERTVVGTIQDATPFSLESRTVGVNSCYVLETNAGFVTTHGVHVGMTVDFH